MRLALGLLTTACLMLLLAMHSPVAAHPVQDERTLRAEKRQRDLDFAKSANEFRLSGIDGRSHTLESINPSGRVTFLSISDTSPSCRQASTTVFSFAEKHSNSKNRFVLVHSGLNADRPLWMNTLASRQKNNPPLILWDPLQMFSIHFGFEQPGDYVTIDVKTKRVLQRARLQAVASCHETPDRGFHLPENLSEVDFKEKFADPFMRACVRCHIFSRTIDYFDSLKSVHGWQAMSTRTMQLARMPAGYEPNPHGVNDIGYSLEDVRWVYRYLLNAKKSDPRIVRFSEAYQTAYRNEHETQFTKITKELGAPDLTLRAPGATKIRASGDLLYRYMNLSEPFKEDRIIRAIILEPHDSDMTVIHHAHVIVVPKKLSDTEIKDLETANASAASAFLKIYGSKSHLAVAMTANGAPLSGVLMDQPIAATFSRPFRFSLQNAGEGVKVPRGSSLAVVLHFESSGRETIEQPKFQIFFAKPKDHRREIRQFTVTPLDLVIPARKNVTVRSTIDIDTPIRLEKLLIHMHYRGTSARVFVRDPEAKTETLVADLPYHLFKLQNFYRFHNLTLKPRSQLITELVFDNTDENIANPDPDQPVKIGRASLDDEMHFPRFFYSIP